MDRYERVIRDVQQKTEDETIQWRTVRVLKYSDVVINPDRVVRSFEADYPVGGKDYVLLFVERRVEHHDDFGYISEGFDYQLLILDEEGQIAVSLYDGVVDRDDLLKLSGLIEERNDRAKAFFASFDASGAA
jgi:hypothetical protein